MNPSYSSECDFSNSLLIFHPKYACTIPINDKAAKVYVGFKYSVKYDDIIEPTTPPIASIPHERVYKSSDPLSLSDLD